VRLRLTGINWASGTLQVMGRVDTRCGFRLHKTSVTPYSGTWKSGHPTLITIMSSFEASPRTGRLLRETAFLPW
jgi:hypothetical protein